MNNVIDTIRSEGPQKRQEFIINSFMDAFGDLIKGQPASMSNKFRKMAVTPFAFYRGSAILFYDDMARDGTSFTDEKTSRVWIQGDLHAANFGTYMNGVGILVFDVNDFDEAYVGPYTWDIKRLLASLSLIGYEKAMSDEEIREVMTAVVRSYVAQVSEFANSLRTKNFALTLSNTTGKLKHLLERTRLQTRASMLDGATHIEDFDRRFIFDKTYHPVEDKTRKEVEASFRQYLETIPSAKRFSNLSYRIKDVSVTRGMGIGSAGLQSFNLLLEGRTQALENDILIYMKQARPAAPSRAVQDERIQKYFLHDGHRTVISQRAMQAYADPWLGYATFDGEGQLVAEVSPYVNDLDWEDINAMDDILGLVKYLGQAVAKVHCISDVDSDQTLVPFSTDDAIHAVLKGHEDEFVKEMVAFGEGYGAIVRDDHRLFIDAFRNHQFPGL